MMSIKRGWPRGEGYIGFFRSPPTPLEVEVRLRDARDVRPIGHDHREVIIEPVPFSPPSPELLRTLADVARINRDMQSVSGIRPVRRGCSDPECTYSYCVEARGPTPQHKAECDCAEWYGSKCVWPDCEGGKSLAKPPSAR